MRTPIGLIRPEPQLVVHHHRCRNAVEVRIRLRIRHNFERHRLWLQLRDDITAVAEHAVSFPINDLTHSAAVGFVQLHACGDLSAMATVDVVLHEPIFDRLAEVRIWMRITYAYMNCTI